MGSAVILTAVFAALIGLSGCGAKASPEAVASAPGGPANGSSNADAAAVCPDGLVSAIETGYGPASVVELSKIEDGLGASLPVDAGCVITYDSSSTGSIGFDVYWPNKDVGFAKVVGQALLSAGYMPGSGDLRYSKGNLWAEITAWPAGDPNWSGYFVGAAVVQVHGDIKPTAAQPAESATPKSPGEVLTWRSACMLTVDEMNAATSSAGITVGSPEADSDPASAACVYSQQNTSAVPARFSIDLYPYSANDKYGFAAESSWTAPSSGEGAVNACDLASKVTYVEGLKAICTSVKGVQVVVGASRLNALVFPPGDYFYVVGVLNVSGSDQLTNPLLQMVTLLAAKEPTPKGA